ncbi:hypothetical protein FPOAC2_03489 [Fusarium poae]|jgi:hypothetical protein
MHLYPPSGRGGAMYRKLVQAYPQRERSLDAIYANVLDYKSAARLARNANRDKALHQYASDSISNHPECHSYLQESVNRIKNGDTLSEDQYASFKQQIKTVYHDTINEFSGVVVTTAVPCCYPRRTQA